MRIKKICTLLEALLYLFHHLKLFTIYPTPVMVSYTMCITGVALEGMFQRTVQPCHIQQLRPTVPALDNSQTAACFWDQSFNKAKHRRRIYRINTQKSKGICIFIIKNTFHLPQHTTINTWLYISVGEHKCNHWFTLLTVPDPAEIPTFPDQSYTYC